MELGRFMHHYVIMLGRAVSKISMAGRRGMACDAKISAKRANPNMRYHDTVNVGM